MNRSLLLVAAVLLTLSLGSVAVGSAEEPAAAALPAMDDGSQAAPQPVSPADPSIKPPDAGGWVCPHCGAKCPGPAWNKKGRIGGPQLGPGPSWGDRRPGRWGRDGDGRGRRAERGHHGFQGARAPRAPRAMAPGGFHGVGARGGVAADRMLHHAADLKLTDEQIGKLERISSDTKKTLIDLHAEIEKGEIDIQNLLRSGSDDMTRIKRQLEAVSKARVGIQEARIAAFFEARDVLTDEQKKMVKDEFPRLGKILD